MAKARVISAKQLKVVNPVYKTQKNQKEINNVVNAAMQEILLNKTDIKLILENAQKQINMLGE